MASPYVIDAPASTQDWWDSLTPASSGGADPITAYFTQKVGRAPTPDELKAYQSSKDAGQNWQLQIDDNAAAPNGWANYLQYGNVNGAAPAAAAPTPTGPSPATFAPQAPLSLPQMAAPTPMAAPMPYTLPTAADVASTPGYQFTRDQGIQGVERSDIARGLGLGGAALKDIAGYTTGLADTYYGNRVNQGMAANQLNFGQRLAVNQNNFGQNLATNQFNSGNALNQFGANLGANQQFWGQGFAENQNAFNQYRGLQNDAFNQWLSLANLGNPGNPYA